MIIMLTIIIKIMMMNMLMKIKMAITRTIFKPGGPNNELNNDDEHDV